MIDCIESIKSKVKDDDNLKYLIIVLDAFITLINENNPANENVISSHLSAVRHC